MKRVLIVMAMAYVATAITACALFGAGVGDSARTGALYTMSSYNTVWQGALTSYANLAPCSDTQKAPCRDKEVYRKLFAIDEAVAGCAPAAVKALKENADYTGLVECMTTVEKAKQAFAKAGVVK